ncbi:MAG: M4 family metallopeptidase [Chitinophagales bacterium]|nr:M4 family metallopeptidase [Chitinophagales bacterium]MDW8418147.1 hypothetical protein [Chitinophagales bacterium]
MHKLFRAALPLLSLLIFSLVIHAQGIIAPEERICKVYFPKSRVDGYDASTAEHYVRKTMPHLFENGSAITHKYSRESPGGFHHAFTQTFQGVEIYRTEVKMNIDRNGIVRAVTDLSYSTSGWSVPSAAFTENTIIFVNPDNNNPMLCAREKANHEELIIHQGEVVFRHDTRSFATDSLVTGKVFNPDPLTTVQQPYGGIYVDNNDLASTWLNNARTTVQFRAAFQGGVFSLVNDYLAINDFDAPTFAPVTTTTPVFDFDRSQSGFEDVNVFYHINRYREHLHSLGFSIANYLLHADPHAMSGADNSYFSYNYSPPRLYFGTGGVDDAEDADVIIHEYGHFLSYNAAPETNFGSQRNALDEGLGDYMAASYSKAISTYNSDKVFNWDGHNEFWSGRVVNTTKKFPNDLTGSIYRNGEIWSTALMNLHDQIGRPATDSLIFETHHYYTGNLTMDVAASLLIEADSALTGGRYFCAIYKHFSDRGFLPTIGNLPCNYASQPDVTPTVFRFKSTGNGFIVESDFEKFTCKIFSLDGRLLDTHHIHASIHEFTGSQLTCGWYIVHLTHSDKTATFRWFKTH